MSTSRPTVNGHSPPDSPTAGLYSTGVTSIDVGDLQCRGLRTECVVSKFCTVFVLIRDH